MLIIVFSSSNELTASSCCLTSSLVSCSSEALMPVPGCLVGGRVLAAGSDSAAVMVIGGPTVAGVCDESMEYSGT